VLAEKVGTAAGTNLMMENSSDPILQSNPAILFGTRFVHSSHPAQVVLRIFFKRA
jgi:hypothetical protein